MNNADVTETNNLAQTPMLTKQEPVVEQPAPNPIIKRRRKNDEIVFQVNPINEFVKAMEYDPSKNNSIRYVAQELFLPDNSLICGRFLAGCWDNGLEVIDDQAIEMIVVGVQMVLKNILSHCIRQRKHFRVTSDKKFYFDVGCEFKDPTIRNTLTRQKIDLEVPPIERKNPDDSNYFSAHQESFNSKKKISLLDIYKSLQDKNVIPSHSISLLSIERLTTLINV